MFVNLEEYNDICINLAKLSEFGIAYFNCWKIKLWGNVYYTILTQAIGRVKAKFLKRMTMLYKKMEKHNEVDVCSL